MFESVKKVNNYVKKRNKIKYKLSQKYEKQTIKLGKLYHYCLIGYSLFLKKGTEYFILILFNSDSISNCNFALMY